MLEEAGYSKDDINSQCLPTPLTNLEVAIQAQFQSSASTISIVTYDGATCYGMLNLELTRCSPATQQLRA